MLYSSHSWSGAVTTRLHISWKANYTNKENDETSCQYAKGVDFMMHLSHVWSLKIFFEKNHLTHFDGLQTCIWDAALSSLAAATARTKSSASPVPTPGPATSENTLT